MKPVALLSLLLTFVPACMAQGFPTSAPSQINVIEELVHPVKIYLYQPPVDVGRAQLPAAPTPEAAVIRYLRAMASGDEEAAFAGWDPESVRMIEENEKRMGRNKAERLTQWAALFKGRAMQLQRKAEYRDLTFVEFTLTENGKVALTDSVAVTKTPNGYQLTMKPVESAVMQGWRNETKRVQRLVK
jgi:hypothetical protein